MDFKNYEQIYKEYKNQSVERAKLEAVTDESSSKDVIAAVRKNEDGDIIAFKMESGRELDYVTALQEAKAGEIAHVDVFHKYGRDIIRSEPDGIEENNLDQLPSF